MDLTEAEDIKKRWQEYTVELYKKDLHDPDNHSDVISHLEPDILDCEVKWALGSITPSVLNTFIFELSNDGKGHGETITDQKPEQVPLVVELWYLFLAEDNTYIIHVLCCAESLSCVQLFVSPWTVACQVPLLMGILQARILEWVAIPSSRGSSQPRNQTWVSCIEGRFFTS